MSLSRELAGALGRAGVERVFGFPGGGGNLDVIEALGEAGIAFVLARSEVGAGLMACATAELTGVPGVVLVGNGPGVTSVVNAVAHAALDRVPLIVISDRYAHGEAGASGHQVLDQLGILAPLTKLSATLDDAAVIEPAIRLALEPRQGPVHLDLPRDLAGAPAAAAVAPARAPAAPPVVAAPPELVAAVAAARRPLLLAGLDAPDDLAALAERLRAPVLCTYKAKGAIPETSEWFAGIITGARIEAPLLAACDLGIAVGFDAVELFPEPWSLPAVALSTYPGQAAFLRPAIEHVGPLGADIRGASEWTPAEVAEHRAALREPLRLGDGLTAWQVVETVQAALPDDARVAVDAGAHMLPAAVFWRATRPRRYLASNGLATMGYALPAAIAAALSDPGTPSVALTGDGGLTYHVAELETAQRLGAKVVAVVFNDASLSLIRIKQQASGRPRGTLDLGPVRYDQVASGFGAAAHRVDDIPSLTAAVHEALDHDGSTLIDVQLTGDEYAGTLRAIRG